MIFLKALVAITLLAQAVRAELPVVSMSVQVNGEMRVITGRLGAFGPPDRLEISTGTLDPITGAPLLLEISCSNLGIMQIDIGTIGQAMKRSYTLPAPKGCTARSGYMQELAIQFGGKAGTILITEQGQTMLRLIEQGSEP